MKFTKIKIQNFFNLENVNIDLNNGNTLIVGPNGSGKTNIIKCVQFLVDKILKKYGGNQQHRSADQHEELQEIWKPNKECCIEVHACFNQAEFKLFSKLRVLFLMAEVCNFVFAIIGFLWKLKKGKVERGEKRDCLQNKLHDGDELSFSDQEDLEILNDSDAESELIDSLPGKLRTKLFGHLLKFDSEMGEVYMVLPNEVNLQSLVDDAGASELVTDFTNDVFPKLLDILKDESHSEDQCHHVELKAYTQNSGKLEFSVDVLDGAWLPAKSERDREYNVISKALAEIFGTELSKHGHFCIRNSDSEDGVSKPLESSFKELLETRCNDSSSIVSAYLLRENGSDCEIECLDRPLKPICGDKDGWLVNNDTFRGMLRETAWGAELSSCVKRLKQKEWGDPCKTGKKAFLQFAAARCLAESTASFILPQNREGAMEQGQFVLTMKSLDQLLVTSKLSEDGLAQGQFNKVKDGMESFCGIEIDVRQKKRVVAQTSAEKSSKELRALAMSLAALSEIDHPLSNTIVQELSQKAPSSSAELHVMLRRTSPYNYESSLTGLSRGEIEILMVLCTIHLSGADTVFLDEPGHCLHPPQQVQLCRWIETLRHPDPVCVLVTHSVEFISRKSLNSLYHMSFVGEGFTSFRLRADSAEEKQQQPLPLDEPSYYLYEDYYVKEESCYVQEVSEKLVGWKPASFESPVSAAEGNPPTDGSKETVPVERQADSEEVGTSTSAPPTSVTAIANPSPKPSDSPEDAILSKEIVSMLIRPDMRKMFFASGLYFVEGETDKIVLSAVKQHLLKNARDTLEKSKSPRELLQAMQVLKMDQWDILALGGCAEAMKAYRAAAELRIPCAIVLDLDTITVKHGKRVEPFTSNTWISSRLYKALTKERQRNSLEVAPLLLDKVDAVFAEGRTKEEALSETRKILQEYGIWIWEGDLESIVCDNTAARQQLLTTECFMEALGEHLSASLSVSGRCSMPTEAALDNYDKRILAPLVPLVDELRAELDAARARLCENPSQRVTEDMQDLVGKIGKFKQRLEKHDDFCEKGTKRRADWPPNHKGSTKKSAGDPSQLVQSHQDDVSMNSETTQPPADEGATGGLSYEQESDREKIMWDRIKHKLHNEGGWMKLPWETLCKVVEVCLEVESSPLQDFCRFMKKWQCKGKKTMKVKDLPRSLLSKLFDSIEDDAED